MSEAKSKVAGGAGVRLVLVNHCAPSLCHVCAVRLRSFGEALARLGHAVVLLTEAPAGEAGDAPADLEARLAGHDWGGGLALSVRPGGAALSRLARTGQLPFGLRQAVIAATYLWRGGLFGDWSDTARPLADSLGRLFKPDAVLASFGNSDCWLLGQRVAAAAGCPWVADVKDPLSVFLPGPVRRAVLRRFADAAAFTALSEGHAGDVQAVLGREATVIRSGIDESLLRPYSAPPSDGPIRLFMMGALYDDIHLAALTEGVRRFAAKASREVVLAYAGGEADRFAGAAAGLATEILGFVPLDRLCREMAASQALLYVSNPRALFQHKLFEMLSAGRPILCLPDETGEAHVLARQVGGSLTGCSDPDSVARALATLAPVGEPAGIGDFTWDAQARVLARLLEEAA